MNSTMSAALDSVLRFGYPLLFAGIFAEQAGIPIPAAPWLLAAGALAGTGRLAFGWALLFAVAAAITADLLWFYAGRKRGLRLLGTLCRIALEPDSCARKTEKIFYRFGSRSLLVAKFVPGLSTAAPPLAGAFGMPLPRFIVLDAIGALLWAGSFLGLGFIFSGQLERIVLWASRFGTALAAFLMLVILAAYIGLRYRRRAAFQARLRADRITPEELKHRLESGEPVMVVDVRHPLDLLASPFVLPGAVRIPLEELGARHTELPRDRDIVLYCTCPSEASSTMAANRLVTLGFTRVHPLLGGYEGWRKSGYPFEPYAFPGLTASVTPSAIWAF